MSRHVLIIVEPEKEQDWTQLFLPFDTLLAEFSDLTVLVKLQRPFLQWLRSDLWSDATQFWQEAEQQISAAIAKLSTPLSLSVEVTTELHLDWLASWCCEKSFDLLWFFSLGATTIPDPIAWFSRFMQKAACPILWWSGEPPQPALLASDVAAQTSASQPSFHLSLLCRPENRQLSMARSFYHEFLSPLYHVTVSPILPDSRKLAADEINLLQGLIGEQVTVESEGVAETILRSPDALAEWSKQQQTSFLLICIDELDASVWQIPLLSYRALEKLPVPMVLLPSVTQLTGQHSFDWSAADALTTTSEVSLFVEQAEFFEQWISPFGGEIEWRLGHMQHWQPAEVVDGCLSVPVAFLDNAPLVEVHLRRGVLEELPPQAPPDTEGLTLGERLCRVFRPTPQPILLFDVELEEKVLETMHHLPFGDDVLRMGVRVWRRRTLAKNRARLVKAGVTAPIVLDACALLEQGEIGDLPNDTEALQMLRVARRLRAQGFCIAGILVSQKGFVDDHNILVLEAKDLTGPEDLDRWRGPWTTACAQKVKPCTTIQEELTQLTNSVTTTGNALSYQFCNRDAREAMLALFEAAEERIHIQVYIVHDDEITQLVEECLTRCAERGVKIRILVDSLYSMHKSFGQKNDWLARLVKHEGVEIRVYRPIQSLPGWETLKQRDHRKFAIVDGKEAIVTGRNLARSYFQGFQEVLLAPDVSEDRVPWLDAGGHVRGPVVTLIEEAFREAWCDAGGEFFESYAHSLVGDTTTRLVIHKGLQDTNTLDAYLCLIRNAEKHLAIVNTFPFQREIVHTLKRALERGVQIDILVGNVRPLYGDREPFPGNPVRNLGTQVVLGRLDPLVHLGVKIYEFAIPQVEHWPSTLGTVWPHVHAKLMVCDGHFATLGSANLDVASGFWESEGMLMIEGQKAVAPIQAQIDAWLSDATLICDSDPRWQKEAEMRRWLDKVWPSAVA